MPFLIYNIGEKRGRGEQNDNGDKHGDVEATTLKKGVLPRPS